MRGEIASARKARIMLVGLFPPAQGGMTTFLVNVLNSYLSETYRFVQYDIARPAKPNVIENWGYRSLFRGGLGRIAIGAAVTAAHVIAFPFAVLRHRVDAVQVQASDYQQFWEAAIYVAVARLLGRPVLMRLGGAFDIFYGRSSRGMKRLIERAVRLPDLLIVQSEYWRQLLARIGRPDGVVVLNNFVLEAEIAALRTPTMRGSRFLFIAGSEARRKGFEVLLDALQVLRDRGDAVRVVMIAVPAVAVQRIRQRGLESMVELRAPMSRDDVLHEMRGAEIFLLPSFGEGFPNSLLEAMAQGMAAIVTPVGSVVDVVGEGKGAMVVPIGDSRALAGAMAQLVGQPELCTRMGAHNQQLVRTRFTPTRVLPNLHEAYSRLLHAPQEASQPSG